MLIQTLNKYDNLDILINICAIQDNEEEIISEVDYIILNRSINTMRRFSLSMKYGVKCLSGVDVPLFGDKLYNQIATFT